MKLTKLFIGFVDAICICFVLIGIAEFVAETVTNCLDPIIIEYETALDFAGWSLAVIVIMVLLREVIWGVYSLKHPKECTFYIGRTISAIGITIASFVYAIVIAADIRVIHISILIACISGCVIQSSFSNDVVVDVETSFVEED